MDAPMRSHGAFCLPITQIHGSKGLVRVCAKCSRCFRCSRAYARFQFRLCPPRRWSAAQAGSENAVEGAPELRERLGCLHVWIGERRDHGIPSNLGKFPAGAQANRRGYGEDVATRRAVFLTAGLATK